MNDHTRIAIDTTFFANAEAKERRIMYSTTQFTADLLDAMAELGFSKYCTLLVNENAENFIKTRFPQYKRMIVGLPLVSHLSLFRNGNRSFSRFLKTHGFYLKAVKRGRFDGIWFPFTDPDTYVETSLPAVLTIHDLYRLHRENDPEAYASIADEQHNQLVTISSFSKADIVQSLHYQKEIPVIPNSVVFTPQQGTPVEGIHKPFIFDLNAYIPKKNPMTLLRAFDLIHNQIPHQLVFCGGYKDEACYQELEQYINDHKLANRVKLLFKVSVPKRDWLLQNTSLFVTPSLFEGFGRTPVEAAISGIPVLSSIETSLKEATQGFVHYYEHAQDSNELAEAMLSVIEHPDTPEKLQEIKEKLIETYRPTTCAKKYIAIFEKLLG